MAVAAVSAQPLMDRSDLAGGHPALSLSGTDDSSASD
jgi:hypothetical protein